MSNWERIGIRPVKSQYYNSCDWERIPTENQKESYPDNPWISVIMVMIRSDENNLWIRLEWSKKKTKRLKYTAQGFPGIFISHLPDSLNKIFVCIFLNCTAFISQYPLGFDQFRMMTDKHGDFSYNKANNFHRKTQNTSVYFVSFHVSVFHSTVLFLVNCRTIFHFFIKFSLISPSIITFTYLQYHLSH